MTLKKLEELGREKLPFTSEWHMDRIRIAVENTYNWDIEMMMLTTDCPSTYDINFYELEFRKQYIAGVIVGWEFVGLMNGI